MRIAIIVSSNIVKDPRIIKQAKLAKSVNEDIMVFGKFDENATSERLKKLDFKYKLIKQKSKDSLISKAFSRISYGLRVVKELKIYKPDIIHANDFDMLVFACLAKNKNQQLIYDAHEIYAHNGKIAKVPFLSKLVMKMEKKLLNKVDFFITVSHAAKQYYRDNGYSKEAEVITNVPYIQQIPKLPKEEKFQVLYQGIISPGRGYEEFAEAAFYLKKYKDIELVIRGYGPTLDEIKKIKIEKELFNLKIEDPVEMGEMIKFATKSMIGVVLTKPISKNYEYTVSNKVFEYLHAGLPVILSPVKEHEYLVEKYNFGIVTKDISPKIIAEAIVKLYEDRSFYEYLKTNTQNSVANLNWETESKKLKKIYESQKE